MVTTKKQSGAKKTAAKAEAKGVQKKVVVETKTAQKKMASKDKSAQKKVVKKSKTESATEKTASKRIVAKHTATRKNRTKKTAGPLVSIVMPAYNAADFIDDTIHSVLGQTYGNWELLIVDDASSDKTIEVVKQFGDDRIQVISLKENGGAAKARNLGISKARGEFLCFIDADDLWQPDKLALQLTFMREKDAAFSFGSYVFADAKGRPNGKVVRVPAVITSIFRLSVILISTTMFDMNKLTKEDLKMDGDLKAIWKRILKKNGNVYGLNKVMTIRGYETDMSLFSRWWRRVR